ncbi:NUDIX hydrolase [Ornithinimicrobium flavum]|uniref:NUDIX hydrolase n=1 Tax=Ornithinimicrobium flavum TaxID=1288636 RepID=UPI0013052A24|nr:NUDIX hydrolase [Ornithinimicrobium flavum]
MDLLTLRRKVGTVALSAFRVTPGPLKRAVVRTVAPSYTVGAVCVIEHDGEFLVLWQPHRRGWSLPGGLLGRGEDPADAVRREVREEVGLDIDPGDPVTIRVDPVEQGVDVVFRVRLERRPELALATEARKARWTSRKGLGKADRDTRGILDLLAGSGRPAREGRLVQDARTNDAADEAYGTGTGDVDVNADAGAGAGAGAEDADPRPDARS